MKKSNDAQIAEKEAYVEFIGKLLMRADMRIIKIVYEFVMRITDQ